MNSGSLRPFVTWSHWTPHCRQRCSWDDFPRSHRRTMGAAVVCCRPRDCCDGSRSFFFSGGSGSAWASTSGWLRQSASCSLRSLSALSRLRWPSGSQAVCNGLRVKVEEEPGTVCPWTLWVPSVSSWTACTWSSWLFFFFGPMSVSFSNGEILVERGFAGSNSGNLKSSFCGEKGGACKEKASARTDVRSNPANDLSVHP